MRDSKEELESLITDSERYIDIIDGVFSDPYHSQYEHFQNVKKELQENLVLLNNALEELCRDQKENPT